MSSETYLISKRVSDISTNNALMLAWDNGLFIAHTSRNFVQFYKSSSWSLLLLIIKYYKVSGTEIFVIWLFEQSKYNKLFYFKHNYSRRLN